MRVTVDFEGGLQGKDFWEKVGEAGSTLLSRALLIVQDGLKSSDFSHGVIGAWTSENPAYCPNFKILGLRAVFESADGKLAIQSHHQQTARVGKGT